MALEARWTCLFPILMKTNHHLNNSNSKYIYIYGFLRGYLTKQPFIFNISHLHFSVFTWQTQGAVEAIVLHPPGSEKAISKALLPAHSKALFPEQ